MAASIVPHPLSCIRLDDDLANVFERDDPAPMSLARLEEFATARSNDYPVESASLNVGTMGEMVAAPTAARQKIGFV